MKRIALRGVIVLSLALALFGVTRGQSTQPTDVDAERLAQTAKRFGMTPEQLDRWVRKELGDPVGIDGDLIVGVRRDATGRVDSVKINTRDRSVEFNREPGEKRPGIRYIGTGVTAEGQFASATDFDGDGRVDQINLREPGANPDGVILIRVGDQFDRAGEALGDGRYKLAGDGRSVRFDHVARQWVEQH